MAQAENVVALTSGYFGVNGESVRVLEGEVLRATDAIVKKFPEHFRAQRATDGLRVEQATAAPGEKR